MTSKRKASLPLKLSEDEHLPFQFMHCEKTLRQVRVRFYCGIGDTAHLSLTCIFCTPLFCSQGLSANPGRTCYVSILVIKRLLRRCLSLEFTSSISRNIQ